MKNLVIQNLGKGTIPRVPFLLAKEHLLGTAYELSLVFPDEALASELHKKWKGKADPANILSFPLGENMGEIFISLEKAQHEHQSFDMTFDEYVLYLFIHGCLHLLGYDHGDIMEHKEKETLDLFKEK